MVDPDRDDYNIDTKVETSRIDRRTWQYFFADGDAARRYALLQMQANEAQRQLWQARSTVRTLRVGSRFTLTQAPLRSGAQSDPGYVVLRVVSVGVNNLPARARQVLEELFGLIPGLLQDVLQEQDVPRDELLAATIAQLADPQQPLSAKFLSIGGMASRAVTRNHMPQ